MGERGRIIVVEGAYSTGKTTQARMLREALFKRWLSGLDRLRDEAEGAPLLVREPGGTQLGERVRSLLLEEGIKRCARSDLMLFCAARAQLLGEVVRPAVDAGRDVVMDRYWLSSVVYQGIIGGVGKVAARWATMIAGADGSLFGDLHLHLVLSSEEQERRTKSRPDGHRFHRYEPGEVAEAYVYAEAELVAEEIRKNKQDSALRRVDADGTPDEVHQRVLAAYDEWRGPKERV